MAIENWKEELEKLSKEVEAGRMIYRAIAFGDAEQFIESLLAAQRTDIDQKIDQLIAEEMLVCHEEGQPTSRLTSLAVKLKSYLSHSL